MVHSRVRRTKKALVSSKVKLEKCGKVGYLFVFIFAKSIAHINSVSVCKKEQSLSRVEPSSFLVLSVTVSL